jgi:hypothetical protein
LAYYVQISRDDLARLEALPHLSVTKLADVLEAVTSILADASDQFREERRLGPGSPYFLFDYIFRDEGRFHQLLFYVNDAHAAAGVLVVAYLEHKVGPLV